MQAIIYKDKKLGTVLIPLQELGIGLEEVDGFITQDPTASSSCQTDVTAYGPAHSRLLCSCNAMSGLQSQGENIPNVKDYSVVILMIILDVFETKILPTSCVNVSISASI